MLYSYLQLVQIQYCCELTSGAVVVTTFGLIDSSQFKTTSTLFKLTYLQTHVIFTAGTIAQHFGHCHGSSRWAGSIESVSSDRNMLTEDLCTGADLDSAFSSSSAQ